MERVINLQVEHLAEGQYLATSEDVPGLVAQGRTMAETIEIARDVVSKLIESFRAHGDPLPPALQGPQPEQTNLRIPVGID